MSTGARPHRVGACPEAPRRLAPRPADPPPANAAATGHRADAAPDLGIPDTSHSIRRCDLSSADWRFLLPSLDPGRVLVFGTPSRGMLSGIATVARKVVVAAPQKSSLAGLGEGIRSRELTNVTAFATCGSKRLPFADGSFDLIVSRQADGAPRTSVDAESMRLLAPGGSLYLETSGVGEALRLSRRVEGFRALGLRVSGRFWLVHRNGQIWAAIPMEDGAPVARYFFDHVLHGTSWKGRLLGALSTSGPALAVLPWILSGRAILLGHASAPPRRQVPFGHLAKGESDRADIVPNFESSRSEPANIDPEESRSRPGSGTGHTGFFAKGAFDANKVTFFRFGPSRVGPDVIVKMTRAPAFNYRLEAEYHTLRQLEDRALVEASSYPRVLFLRHHQGLAVLGQEVVDGSPFRTRTNGQPDCPFARAAVEWITTLASGSSGVANLPTMDTPGVLGTPGITGTPGTSDTPGTEGTPADRFGRLLHALDGLYSLTSKERGFLEERMVRLDESRHVLPLVFRHGDAGTWNAMVTRDDMVAFLDWEAGEAEGPPLWDLFDFLRSFGNWVGRVRGERDNLRNYEDGFLRPGALSELQGDAVVRYCTAAHIPRDLVEPLFFGCWMQRALREAEWSQAALDEGTYINLTRLCIRRRHAPGLGRVFA